MNCDCKCSKEPRPDSKPSHHGKASALHGTHIYPVSYGLCNTSLVGRISVHSWTLMTLLLILSLWERTASSIIYNITINVSIKWTINKRINHRCYKSRRGCEGWCVVCETDWPYHRNTSEKQGRRCECPCLMTRFELWTVSFICGSDTGTPRW